MFIIIKKSSIANINFEIKTKKLIPLAKRRAMKIKFLEIRKYFILKILALVGVGALSYSCLQGSSKKETTNQKDSIQALQEKDTVKKDSVISKPITDTVKKTSTKPHTQTSPTITKYGVPEPMPTKYGVPQNFQTKYGVPSPD